MSASPDPIPVNVIFRALSYSWRNTAAHGESVCLLPRSLIIAVPLTVYGR